MRYPAVNNCPILASDCSPRLLRKINVNLSEIEIATIGSDQVRVFRCSLSPFHSVRLTPFLQSIKYMTFTLLIRGSLLALFLNLIPTYDVNSPFIWISSIDMSVT
jgi:hypothetical protein